jgi:hypothetical protein
MSKTTKKDSCERVLSRQDKLDKWERIYSKALNIIYVCLGSDKDAVYAACHSIQTASREIGIIENHIRLLDSDSQQWEMSFKLPEYDDALRNN